jgi:ribosome-associated translation inhibitor RaiA
MADIVIKGRHVEVPAQLRAYMEDKLAKVSKLAPKAIGSNSPACRPAR